MVGPAMAFQSLLLSTVKMALLSRLFKVMVAAKARVQAKARVPRRGMVMPWVIPVNRAKGAERD